MKAKSRRKAITTSIIAVIVWIVLPVCVIGFITVFFRVHSDGPPLYLYLMSPGMIVPATEFSILRQSIPKLHPLVLVVVNFAFYAAVLYGIRRRVLRNADTYLGRVPGG